MDDHEKIVQPIKQALEAAIEEKQNLEQRVEELEHKVEIVEKKVDE